MTLIDGLGRFIFHFSKGNRPTGVKQILVIRLDHIGDIVLSEPFFNRLKFKYPGVKVTLLTSSAGEAVFRMLPAIDEIRILDVPWFQFEGKRKSLFKTWCSMIQVIKSIPADIIIDLRGDFRHITAARMAKPGAWIQSFGITGGGFLLNEELPYPHEVHAAKRNLRFLDPQGREASLVLSSDIASEPLDRIVKSLLPAKMRPWVTLHPGAGHSSKLWPVEQWAKLLKTLGQEQVYDFFWIGDEKTKEKVQEIKEHLKPDLKSRFVNLCGILPLSQLGSFLGKCDLLISTDSGPVHIAAARKLRTVVLFSAVNEKKEWSPLNENARVLTFQEDLEPEVVARVVRESLMQERNSVGGQSLQQERGQSLIGGDSH